MENSNAQRYKIFRGDGETLKRIDVPENSDKNNLPIGTVLHLNGYSDPDYVITKNLGINSFSGYGANYETVNIEDKTFSQHQAYSLKYLSEKQDGRIQTYITDRKLSDDEVLELRSAAIKKQNSFIEAKEKAKTEAERLEKIGRDLFKKHIPDNTKALIIAQHEVDDCDLQTDYFNTQKDETIILGFSTHTRKLFPEMRKLAAKLPETEHLSIKPKTNNNDELKTEDNKEWWTAKDEHRENYSMGAGTYLKDSSRYSTGWLIKKQVKWNNDWDKDLYISIAKKCLF